MSIGNAGDNGAKPKPRGLTGEEAESGVGFQHVLVRGSEWGDLEEVVHERDTVNPGRLDALDNRRQRGGDGRRPARPGKAIDVNAKVHDGILIVTSSIGRPSLHRVIEGRT